MYSIIKPKLIIFFILVRLITGRKHHLEVRDDVRRYIALSSYGFLYGGTLDVKLINFRIEPNRSSELFGFTLDKTSSDAMNPFIDDHQERCIFETPIIKQSGPIAYLVMNFTSNTMRVNFSGDWNNYNIYEKFPIIQPKIKRSPDISDSQEIIVSRKRRSSSDTTKGFDIPMSFGTKDGFRFYNVSFGMMVLRAQCEGLYNLYFHACPNYQRNLFPLEFDVNIVEKNIDNYLSAGEIPLPPFYFMMSLIFFLSGLFWCFLLKKSTHTVFRIHYIMAVLVFLKSLTLMFHSINFHYIEVKGEHVEAWAILYYITHLLKGAVLFITIVLIGTGWTFIKHILADKDKKLFMIVIPLQILANVAEIIIAESEEGDIERRTWSDILILVDLICCGAILFPVVWSIRHLQEASSTDGKAAINLRKLKLFRQFYLMIVCYIYFTRIIVYLLKVTVPFQYLWLDELFKESGTYIFYALTAYKFRPVPFHPYFTVDTDDDDEVDVLTVSGLSQELHKTTATNRTQVPSKANLKAVTSTQSASAMDGNDEEKENLLINRESSHEYD